jgi:hypothetical protein
MIRIYLLTLALSFGVAFSNCNSTPSNDIVTINYEQIGACNGFNSASGLTSAGPKAAFVVFRVSSIENKGSAARDFTFDPNLLFINGSSPRAYASTRLNLAQINPFAAKSRFVAKGTTETLNGAVIAVASTAAVDGASEANNTSYFLAYETPSGGQGVVLVKKDPSRTSWPSTPDCTNIIY